jgi:hypothetical protein
MWIKASRSGPSRVFAKGQTSCNTAFASSSLTTSSSVIFL